MTTPNWTGPKQNSSFSFSSSGHYLQLLSDRKPVTYSPGTAIDPSGLDPAFRASESLTKSTTSNLSGSCPLHNQSDPSKTTAWPCHSWSISCSHFWINSNLVASYSRFVNVFHIFSASQHIPKDSIIPVISIFYTPRLLYILFFPGMSFSYSLPGYIWNWLKNIYTW